MATNVKVWTPPVIGDCLNAKEVNGHPVRYRCAWGGRGSGKTRSFAKAAAYRGMVYGSQGREGIILCGREFMNSLDDSSMEEIKHAIREEPLLSAYYEIGEKFIRSRYGNIRFVFSGLDRNINSIKSKSRILLFWADEAEEIKESSWAKITPTVREDGSEIWVTWNPESKRSATNKRFRESPPDDAIVVKCNWRDNPRFPDVLERERQNDQKNRPDDYGWIWEGEFKTHVEGAYYAPEMAKAASDGRICADVYDDDLPVHTAWDLGMGDSTAIWLFQIAPGGLRIIGYYENHGQKLAHYTEWLDAHDYEWGHDFVPHDARVRELGTGRTRLETLAGLGRKPRLVAIHAVDDGINAVRETLAKCWFDEEACDEGLDALRSYASEFDDKKSTFKPVPRHDWASHGADAFRYLAMGWRELTKAKKKPPPPPKNKIPLPPPPSVAKPVGMRRTNL